MNLVSKLPALLACPGGAAQCLFDAALSALAAPPGAHAIVAAADP